MFNCDTQERLCKCLFVFNYDICVFIRLILHTSVYIFNYDMYTSHVLICLNILYMNVFKYLINIVACMFYISNYDILMSIPLILVYMHVLICLIRPYGMTVFICLIMKYKYFDVSL